MSDYAEARRHMVDGQIRTHDVTDLRVISAFLEVPRERFLPAEKAGLAYLDWDVSVGKDAASRKLLKPMVLAKLIQAAAPGLDDRVLDVACGTGYSSAVISRLAGEVVALDEDAGLTRQAERNLSAAPTFESATVVTGPLSAGWSAKAPYDVILVNGAIEVVPQPLLEQLKDGGRLVCILGTTPGKATLYLRSGKDFGGRPLFDASAAVLPGFAKTPAFVF